MKMLSYIDRNIQLSKKSLILCTSRIQTTPKKGDCIKVETIRTKKAIRKIKKLLNPRDRCLFTLGINTAYRAKELLSITHSQVQGVVAGDTLEIEQSKIDKYRRVTLNKSSIREIEYFINHDDNLNIRDNKGFLFYSKKGGVHKVSTATRMVKHWCSADGLSGNYGSHTLRKTWGYWQYKRGINIPLLMVAFGNSTKKQALAYLCTQEKNVQEIYNLKL